MGALYIALTLKDRNRQEQQHLFLKLVMLSTSQCIYSNDLGFVNVMSVFSMSVVISLPGIAWMLFVCERHLSTCLEQP